MLDQLSSSHGNNGSLYPANGKGKKEVDVVIRKVRASSSQALPVPNGDSASLGNVMVEVEVPSVSVSPDRPTQLKKLSDKEIKQLLDEGIDRLQNDWDLDAYITFYSIETRKKDRVERRDLLFALERYENLKNANDENLVELERIFSSRTDFGKIVRELDYLYRQAGLAELSDRQVEELLDEAMNYLLTEKEMVAWGAFSKFQRSEENKHDLLFALERYETLRNHDRELGILDGLFAEAVVSDEAEFEKIVQELDRLEGRGLTGFEGLADSVAAAEKRRIMKVIGGVVLAIGLLVAAGLLVYNFAAVKHAVSGGPKAPIGPHGPPIHNKPPIHPISPPVKQPGSGFGLHHGVWGWKHPRG